MGELRALFRWVRSETEIGRIEPQISAQLAPENE